jgi:hypothetical protein
VSVDPQLTVGGPASSDCWGNGRPGATCYGGHPRPTAEDLLSTVGMNWALGLVEYGAKENLRVDFSSSHGYSEPCGNATALCGWRGVLRLFCLGVIISSAPRSCAVWPYPRMLRRQTTSSRCSKT